MVEFMFSTGQQQKITTCRGCRRRTLNLKTSCSLWARPVSTRLGSRYDIYRLPPQLRVQDRARGFCKWHLQVAVHEFLQCQFCCPGHSADLNLKTIIARVCMCLEGIFQVPAAPPAIEQAVEDWLAHEFGSCALRKTSKRRYSTTCFHRTNARRPHHYRRCSFAPQRWDNDWSDCTNKRASYRKSWLSVS